MSESPMSFQAQLERFRERTAMYRGHYQALILPGTRQHITAALLIGGLEPQRVAFLLTEQTRDMPEKVKTELANVTTALSHSPKDWLVLPGDHATTDTVYQGIKQVLEHWHDVPPTAIAVDVTGGFALMSVGIAKAAHVLRLTTIYILSDFHQETNRVIPGTQRLEFPPDPYTVFGDLEADEARRLYRTHDYAGARRIFADLSSRRVPESDKQSYRAYALLAQSYTDWDVFAWDKAAAALAALHTPPFPADLEPYHKRLQAQLIALQQLTSDNEQWEKKPTLTLLQDQTSVLPLLGSLYANARRREAQGRYDVAALFSYRCLELMSQHRLATWGILTEKPNFDGVPQGVRTLEHSYRAMQRTQNQKRYEREKQQNAQAHKRNKIHGLPNRISMFAGYMLLAVLGDDLVRDYDISQIEARTDARNKSMLAHGFRLITSAEYEQFRAVVEELLDRFFVVIEDDRHHWEQTYQFVCPFAHEAEE
jgi:CRISPR-associated protein (TIGR02710 family)